MIRAFYGIDENPFSIDNINLLSHQLQIQETIKVHCQQGGFCIVLGVPGTGKSVIKESLKQVNDKRIIIVSISRTLHTYTNTLKVLCQAFNLDYEGSYFKCEKRLIEEAFSFNRQGKMIITIIDDAHLMDVNTLRRFRLLFEDFPKNHNLILIGQPLLMNSLNLSVNTDIKSRVTYSAIMKKINQDDMSRFILDQLDRVKLGHNTFSEDAIDLIVRSSDGILRKARNLCLSSLLEAVRCRNKSIDLDIVNKVLIQPHWRNDSDLDYLL